LGSACGSGRISQAAIDAGLEAVGTDLIARWQRTKVLNFLQASTGACNIVSNRRDGANDKTRFEHNRSASASISTMPGIWSAILQQDQTLPPDRNALRQAGGELPRIGSACIHTPIAAR
jgi:hypothetical protein